MKRTKISFYFIFIGIFTFITLFLIIVQKSYESLIKPTNQVKESSLTPINPKIDMEVISEIESRKEVPIDAKLEIVNDLVETNKINESSSAAVISPAPKQP